MKSLSLKQLFLKIQKNVNWRRAVPVFVRALFWYNKLYSSEISRSDSLIIMFEGCFELSGQVIKPSLSGARAGDTETLWKVLVQPDARHTNNDQCLCACVSHWRPLFWALLSGSERASFGEISTWDGSQKRLLGRRSESGLECFGLIVLKRLSERWGLPARWL